jgi:hypothetical protein
MMETLGIHMNVQDLGSAGDVEKSEEIQPGSDTELESVTIRDASKVPKTIRSSPAIPAWIPNG